MPAMHSCIILLGSNVLQPSHLSEARRRLAQVLLSPTFTEELWSQSFTPHAAHPLYLNQLVYARTPLQAPQLVTLLKGIEAAMGRTPAQRATGMVSIDLDLLQHDDVRYHQRDWERPYVQQLLKSHHH